MKTLLMHPAGLALFSSLVLLVVRTDVGPVPPVAVALTGSEAGVWKTHANGDSVQGLLVDGDYIWAWTDGGGAVRWDTRDGSYVQYLGPQNGLASNTVNTVAVDNQGRAWFGTPTGLSVFDGRSWMSYHVLNSGLAANDIGALVADRQGRVWLSYATQDPGLGVTWFDGRSWTTYATYNSGLTDSRVWEIAVNSEGRAWFWTGSRSPEADRGVNTFDGHTWTTYNGVKEAIEHDYSHALTTLNASRLWVVQPPDKIWTTAVERGVSVYDGSTWQSYTTENSELAGDEVQAIAFDSLGRVWFGTNRGVDIYDGSNWVTLNRDNSELPGDYVEALVIDNEDVAWMVTLEIPWIYGPSYRVPGITVLSGTEWRTYQTGATGLAGNTIKAIAPDQSGRVWITTGEEIGLNLFDCENWTTYTPENTAQRGDQVTTVLEEAPAGSLEILVNPVDRDYAEIAFFSRYVMLGNDPTIYQYRAGGGGSDRVSYIAIWPALKQGLDTGAPVYAVDVGLHDSGPIAVDRQGQVWVGGNKGLSVFDGEGWTTYTYENTRQRGGQVTTVREDTPAGRSSVPVNFTDQYEADLALEFGYVMFWDDPTIYEYTWYSDYGQSITIEPSLQQNLTAGAPVFGVRGLTSNGVTAIAIDEQGRVWIGTEDQGVSSFDGTTWMTYTTQNTRHRGDQVTTVREDTLAGESLVPLNFTNRAEVPGYVMFGDDPTFYEYYRYVEELQAIQIIPPLRRAVNEGTPVYDTRGLVDNEIGAVAVDPKDRVWIGTEWKGINIFDGASWVALRGIGEIRAIAFDRQGRAWVGSRADHVFVCDGTLQTCGRPPAGYSDGYVNTVAIDRLGRAWVGTDWGVSVFDGQSWTTYQLQNSGLVSNLVTAVAADLQGQMWIGTLNSGVSVLFEHLDSVYLPLLARSESAQR